MPSKPAPKPKTKPLYKRGRRPTRRVAPEDLDAATQERLITLRLVQNVGLPHVCKKLGMPDEQVRLAMETTWFRQAAQEQADLLKDLRTQGEEAKIRFGVDAEERIREVTAELLKAFQKQTSGLDAEDPISLRYAAKTATMLSDLVNSVSGRTQAERMQAAQAGAAKVVNAAIAFGGDPAKAHSQVLEAGIDLERIFRSSAPPALPGAGTVNAQERGLLD